MMGFLSKKGRELTEAPRCKSTCRPPPFTNSLLITLAIVSGTGDSFTTSQIVDTITQMFPYFESCSKSGFRRSILRTLNVKKKAFLKTSSEFDKESSWNIRMPVDTVIKILEKAANYLETEESEESSLEASPKKKSLKNRWSEEEQSDDENLFDDGRVVPHTYGAAMLDLALPYLEQQTPHFTYQKVSTFCFEEDYFPKYSHLKKSNSILTLLLPLIKVFGKALSKAPIIKTSSSESDGRNCVDSCGRKKESPTKRKPQNPPLPTCELLKISSLEEDESDLWEEKDLLRPCSGDSPLEEKCKKLIENIDQSGSYPLSVIVTTAITLSPSGYLSLKGIYSFIDKFFPSKRGWKQYVRPIMKSKDFIQIGSKERYWTVTPNAAAKLLRFQKVRINDGFSFPGLHI
ncbi:hypothetical protein J6590_073204 [Homalodisca vitripennis]|nr:hypothetical protein J6590_073204 [Homalodisca vitripennis]